jgi:hypothetical protein
LTVGNVRSGVGIQLKEIAMPSTSTKQRRPRPMNVHVHRGSAAERKYRAVAGVPGLTPEEGAAGLPSTPSHDLLFHGGKTIKDLTYTNFYVGADAWDQSDMRNIDRALDAAMSEPTLNNVMAQYFAGVPTTKFVPSRKLPGPAPDQVTKEDIEELVTTLHGQGKLAGFDFGSAVFNFMLPRGTVLTDDPIAGEREGGHKAKRPPVGDEDDKASSLEGLGGFHGSVQAGGTTIYYAVGVYSEASGGQSNGIPVFDAPWKNVVATFYHELNEARTDPDVEQVIDGGPVSLLGWNSWQGEECGDFPVFEANPLTKVFQEVSVAGGGTAPVQFQYSNFVHGPEGPAASPHPPAKQRGTRRSAA